MNFSELESSVQRLVDDAACPQDVLDLVSYLNQIIGDIIACIEIEELESNEI